MKNMDIKLVLFYLVFMLSLKAGAQVNQADSVKYAKELRLDLSTKIKFIKNNNSKGYKNLLLDLNRSSIKYSRDMDSLLNLAKVIVKNETGDELLTESLKYMPDTLIRNGKPLDLFEIKKAKDLLARVDQKSKEHMAKSQGMIDKKLVETLSDGWSFLQTPIAKENFFRKLLEKIFGKGK